MMKMSRGVIIACLLSLLALNCQSVFRELNSIDDLRTIYSYKSLPLHSLTLLHWIANEVDIDNNNDVHLSFDVNRDFGSHFYRNGESLLPSAPRGNWYYTVGNIDRVPEYTCPSYQDYPDYVISPRVLEYSGTGRNRDRLIVSVQQQNSGSRTVSQIYLTQHFRRADNQGSEYDPNHTFVISTSLLQQLRQFSFHDNSLSLHDLRTQYDNNIDDDQLNGIINIWGSKEAPLGLLYLIVLPQRKNQFGVCESNRRSARDVEATIKGDWQNCEIQHMHFQVKTGSSGRAMIHWRNVPGDQLKGVAVVLFRNQMDQGSRITYKKIQESEGSYETNEPLNEGLQVRLHKIKYWVKIMEEICRGREFKSPHPVSVTGYSQLQLFVKDGKACYRLYIKKGCDRWKSDFYQSWVGLYTSASADTSQYRDWRWAIKLEQGQPFGEYDTFEHCTGTKVTPGLQARLMIDKGYVEKARTPMWV